MALETAAPAVSTDKHPQVEGTKPQPKQARDDGYRQPEVDVPALRSLLDGAYHEIRDLVRANLVEHASVLDDEERLDRDAFRERVLEVTLEMAATGQTGMGFPTEYGGGGDIGASIAAFETLAFGDLSVLIKVGVQIGLFGGAILQLGTGSHHDAYLRDIISGDLLGCFAMTESGHGSNVQRLATTATYDPETEEFVLDTPDDAARKDYIGNAAAHGELAVVFAQLRTGTAGSEPEQHGVHAFVVPIRAAGQPLPGVRIEDCGPKMGLNGVDNGRLWFDGVRVPRENLLDRFAEVHADGTYGSSIENSNRRFFTMLGTLVQGRVCIAGAGINAAKVAITLAVEYAVRRRQFERAQTPDEGLLLDYGLHQRRLFPPLAKTYALHFAQEQVAADLHEVFSGLDDDPQARRELEARAAGLKALGTWHATSTIQQSREACGGAGYLSVNRFAALKADTDVFTTFEGDNHVLLQLVAKGLLTDYASEFADLDQFAMVKFVSGMAVETLIEKTNVHTLLNRIKDLLPGGDQWDQEAGLLDPNYQLTMLRFREEHQLAGLARRLKRGVDSGQESGVVFSQAQDHVIAVARAHVERVVLEAFVDKVRAAKKDAAAESDTDNAVALGLLCDLFALSTIEADRGWFMEHGRLGVSRSKAITREIGDLCRKIRPLAPELVQSFGVPHEMLRAPDLIGGQ